MSFCCCVKSSPSPTDSAKTEKPVVPASENIIQSAPQRSEPKEQPKINGAQNIINNNSKPTEIKEPVSTEVIQLTEHQHYTAEVTQLSAELEAHKDDLTPEMATELAGLIKRLETVTCRLEATASGGGPAGPCGPAPGAAPTMDAECTTPFVLAFDDLCNGSLAEFLAAANKIGGDVQTQCAIIGQCFKNLRNFLVVVARCKQPDQNKLQELLKPISDKLSDVQSFREQNRGSAFFNHLSAMSESIPAVGWVAVSPAPGPYVKEMSDAGQFYTNRVLKEYRDKDKTHVDWTRAWLRTLTEMQAYIKQHHTTGASWNRQGVDASSLPSSGGSAAPPPPGPPPPPAPAAPGPPPPSSAAGGAKDDRSALLTSLNQGADVTKGLKKVTKDMQTHKNPDLRLHSAVPFKASPKPFKSMGSGRSDTLPDKPAKCELQGKKWIVEYQKGNKNIVIDDTNVKQAVYAFRCTDSTITVKGKINAITLDGCKKTAVVFEDVISTVDFVNCQSIQAQVTGSVHTVSIEKTDGCQVYLSEKALNCEIISAKSSEMNILVPQASGEFKEFALPEQYKTVYDGKSMVTTISEI